MRNEDLINLTNEQIEEKLDRFLKECRNSKHEPLIDNMFEYSDVVKVQSQSYIGQIGSRISVYKRSANRKTNNIPYEHPNKTISREGYFYLIDLLNEIAIRKEEKNVFEEEDLF